MRKSRNHIKEQVQLIQLAMQQAGFWKQELPSWICSFNEENIPDIWEWLQFVYLPMRLENGTPEPQHLAPKIIRFMHENPSAQTILRLIIELDSLTPVTSNKKIGYEN